MVIEATGIMATPIPKYVAIGVVIVVGLVVLNRLDLRRQRARRRRKNNSVEHYASRHGYRYAALDDSVDPGWSVWPFDDQQIVPDTVAHRNVIRGTSGDREFVTFEYVRIVRTGNAHDTTHAGAGTRFWRTSVVAVRTPAAWSPKVSIAGHSGVSALTNVVTGGVAVNYLTSQKTGDRGFDLRFQVTTEDADFAKRLLNDRVRAALLATRVSQRQNAFAAGSGYRVALDLGWLMVIEGAEDPDVRLREGLAAIAAVLDNADPGIWPQARMSG